MKNFKLLFAALSLLLMSFSFADQNPGPGKWRFIADKNVRYGPDHDVIIVTGTDYLDDVSKTYVDPSIFPTLPNGDPSPAYLLHDRSYELGDPIGIPGRQRGVMTQKDQFATAIFYISFNLQSYKCPTAN